MWLTCRHELAFITATLTYRGSTIEIPDVLIDTGAASTVIDADHAAVAGIYPEATDRLRRLRGVGGYEHVFVRTIDRFAVGDHGLDGFEIEIGELDYGFRFGGILGMDFLCAARATLDLGALTIEFSGPR
ncbi:MAG TPA: retropepsin-like aspartic protease [Kofleriaceae bacterium]|nr:retropepsin-like aspartic protease [Kofleriaceae bacterium]